MQFARDIDGTDTELPRKNIDTGAGLERILGVLQGVDSVFDTDVLKPLVETAERVTGTRLGAADRSDISLRILAEHARTMSFLVSDGVFPSNEGRGYVLRRIIRRAVREAYLLDVADLVTPSLVDTTVEIMGESYPDLVKHHDFVRNVVAREEERFRATLRSGTNLLDAELDKLPDGGRIGGSVAFLLHDTHGFPLELTREIGLERGHDVDQAGLRHRDGRAAAPGQGRPQGRGRRGRRALPRARRAVRADRVRRRRRLRGGGRRDRPHRRLGRARPHALLRGVGRPGRRHGLDQLRHRSGRGPRHRLRLARHRAPQDRPRRGRARGRAEREGRHRR